jgi:hypothetical protein
MSSPTSPELLINLSAIVTALAVAVAAFAKLATGVCHLLYTKIVATGIALLFILFAAAAISRFVAPIVGWTDQEAAENIIARMPGVLNPNIPARVVREIPSSIRSPHFSFPLRPSDSSFVVYQGDKPIAHIVVQPYHKYWLTLKFSGTTLETVER